MGGNIAQQVGISPAATTGNYNVTQSLCATSSPPSVDVPVTPCSELSAPIIRPPLPGENFIEVIQAAPGARILVYGPDGEIGDGGGSPVMLIRPLVAGETIKVVQQVGDCRSAWVYEVRVQCTATGDATGCAGDWPAFRQNGLRNAQQTQSSVLADPAAVRRLAIRWQFRPAGGAAFRASPIIRGNRVFIGNGNGRFYALDAGSGALLWQYPPAAQPALTSQFTCNPSSDGIAASAAIARTRERELVIFGAPDQSIGAKLGSGRLFALDPATGTEVWKSPEIAILNGLTEYNVKERHEQLGYSSPLVFNGVVYVGIANHCDSPIQNGRVVAVDANTGSVLPGFNFVATGNRGGGVWSSVAGGLPDGGVYATTGNTNSFCDGCDTEPSPNHGLSMLRLDAGSGALAWKLQPVPFDLDGDPDWASGPALVDASCGPVVASTMKDGWAYAANASSGSAPAASVRWQFPATGFPFTSGDGTAHGDTRYLIPGAIWGQVFLTTAGGEATTTALNQGLRRIHALNICGGPRVRWVADIPGLAASSYQLGPPTATRGIVFVGTSRGHLVALADPSVYATAMSRCSNPQIPLSACVANGFYVVPEPRFLLDLDLNPGNSGDRIATEPALAGGRVFVATSDGAGTLYMLEPR
jgi:outer membrane protein assembly factor BamB